MPDAERRLRVGIARASASAAPESNSPALKKYGLTRPDLSVNSPKRSALRWQGEVEEFALVGKHGAVAEG